MCSQDQQYSGSLSVSHEGLSSVHEVSPIKTKSSRFFIVIFSQRYSNILLSLH